MINRYRGRRFTAAVMAAVLTMMSVIVNVGAAYMPETLVPMGRTVGIMLESEGVIVVGVGELETESGCVSPAKDAGICPGDIILKYNGRDISTCEDLKRAVCESEGKCAVQICRGGKLMQVNIVPHRDAEGGKIGLWLRDGLAGLGTVTFYDPETGIYGALGHGVNDVDTGVQMPVRSGSLTDAKVQNVVPGCVGSPGQLEGSFDMDSVIGDIHANTDMGIFGYMNSECVGTGCEAIPIARDEEIETGAATICSTVDGNNIGEYTVEISRVYFDEGETRLMLKVTDEELLSITGGIVRGMSGSPIIQGGKLVGAVTHVLVNDPTKGYGVSVETMLSAMNDNLQGTGI